MSQAIVSQCFAYACVGNALTIRPAAERVGGFVRIPTQVLLSGSSLEITSSKIQRRSSVCHATAAPEVSFTLDLALNITTIIICGHRSNPFQFFLSPPLTEHRICPLC